MIVNLTKTLIDGFPTTFAEMSHRTTFAENDISAEREKTTFAESGQVSQKVTFQRKFQNFANV